MSNANKRLEHLEHAIVGRNGSTPDWAARQVRQMSDADLLSFAAEIVAARLAESDPAAALAWRDSLAGLDGAAYNAAVVAAASAIA
jgi:hypothetical protein